MLNLQLAFSVQHFTVLPLKINLRMLSVDLSLIKIAFLKILTGIRKERAGQVNGGRTRQASASLLGLHNAERETDRGSESRPGPGVHVEQPQQGAGSERSQPAGGAPVSAGRGKRKVYVLSMICLEFRHP